MTAYDNPDQLSKWEQYVKNTWGIDAGESYDEDNFGGYDRTEVEMTTLLNSYNYNLDFNKNEDLLVEENGYDTVMNGTLLRDIGWDWVAMSDMQTPILYANRPHNQPRLLVGHLTPYEATRLIKDLWQLPDLGFVCVDAEKRLFVWNWWD